ncbi:ArnT family glycosyltransferase [Streptomyces sp. T028]|uniref:ArnT family glycosyltransferase n=1 Tax=Streptomyces sp. T028 TaxID=3394379 RepID=UPI003A881222
MARLGSDSLSLLSRGPRSITAGGRPEAAQPAPGPEPGRPPRLRRPGRHGAWLLGTAAPLTAILAAAATLRFWQLSATGFNSDEAVYTGSAATLAGDPVLRDLFPAFRSHPLMFQTLVSLALHGGTHDFAARAVAAVIGVVTVAVVYLLGKQLYGRTAGLAAAALLAVMPYHVVVTRQVLLEGLVTLCATGVLYCVARYVQSGAALWTSAAGAVLGTAILTKETSVVLLLGLWLFFMLTRGVHIPWRHTLYALGSATAVVAAFPLAAWLAGSKRTTQDYLLWQLLRRANHSVWFYFTTLPGAVGWGVLAVALAGVLWLRRRGTWREPLLLWWIAVPLVFFTLWPVRGYQYLLPVVPALAVLAGRALAAVAALPARRRWLPATASLVLSAGLIASLAVPAAERTTPSVSGTFLAGTGGVPGGREAGEWVRDNAPRGAQLLAGGPSMANILQFYGHHPVSGLSVSVDPLKRNPSYQPVPNPDRALRNAEFQYVVWDSYTAARSPFHAEKIRRLAEKYHGVAVYTSTTKVETGSGKGTAAPVIVIYQVRAS